MSDFFHTSSQNQESDGKKICALPIDSIENNPYQPRSAIDQEKLMELSQSILSLGLLHPILVRRKKDQSQEQAKYLLIAGQRRLKACKMAGLHIVPAIIDEQASPQEHEEMSLVENIQRQELNPMEIAFALDKILKKSTLKQEEMARRLGMQRSSISNYLRLLHLEKNIQEKIRNKTLSFGHAKVLLSLKNSHKRLELCKLIEEGQLSVRKAESKAQMLQKKPDDHVSKASTRNFYLESLAIDLEGRLQSQVKIHEGPRQEGRIEIKFFNYEHLTNILERIPNEEED